jgi:hypothetical protein
MGFAVARAADRISPQGVGSGRPLGVLSRGASRLIFSRGETVSSLASPRGVREAQYCWLEDGYD